MGGCFLDSVVRIGGCMTTSKGGGGKGEERRGSSARRFPSPSMMMNWVLWGGKVALREGTISDDGPSQWNSPSSLAWVLVAKQFMPGLVAGADLKQGSASTVRDLCDLLVRMKERSRTSLPPPLPYLRRGCLSNVPPLPLFSRWLSLQELGEKVASKKLAKEWKRVWGVAAGKLIFKNPESSWICLYIYLQTRNKGDHPAPPYVLAGTCARSALSSGVN